MSGVRTITCHHTANGGAPGNAPSLIVVQKGRPGLTGPLAHFVLAKNGTVFVVAAGLCYHAGVSLKTDYTNENAVGIEAEAVGVPGTKGDWPAVQMDAYHRLCRALIDHFGLDVADVRGHKETCSPKGRKSDPDFDMTAFRAAVAAVDLEDTMANLTAKEIADAVWADDVIPDEQDPTNATWRASSSLARVKRRTDAIEKKLDDEIAVSAARHAELLAALATLTPGPA